MSPEPPTDLESQLVQSIAAVNGENGNGHPPAASQNDATQNGSLRANPRCRPL